MWWIKRVIRRWLDLEPYICFNVGPFSEQFNIHQKMKQTLTDSQQFDVSVAFQDRHGHPATIAGIPTWESSDTNLLTVEASEDGLSAKVKAVGEVGLGQIIMKAEGTSTPGEDPIVGILDVEVVGGRAAIAVFSPTAPVEQPE
jgi:hypothetical protein